MTVHGSRRRERGETLIELIVAVAIMGTSIAIIVGALAAAVANATRQRTDAKGQAALNTYAERVKRVPFVPCATPGDYNRDLDLAELAKGLAGYTPGVTHVAPWDGGAYLPGSKLTAEVGTGADEILVADEDAFQNTGSPVTIRVDSSTVAETFTVIGGWGTKTLKVTPPASVVHEEGAAVSRCPPDKPGSPYQAQLLDIGVTGPAASGLDPAERYTAAMTVAKRGPLNVPTLTADEPVRTLSPDDDTRPATATAGTPVVLEFEATLAGAIDPGGKITFSVFDADQFDESTGACTGATPHTATADVTGNGTVTARLSSAFTPEKAGDGAYRWIAAYGGDDANEGVTVTCGPDAQRIDVAKAIPTLSTELVVPVGERPTARAGDQTAVKARLEGGAAPTGTLTFELFGPGGDCGGTPRTGPDEDDVVPGGETPSLPYTFAETDGEGSYRWRVRYLGDDNNEDVEACPVDNDPADAARIVRFTP